MKAILNEELLKKQKVTDEQKEKLYKIYEEITQILNSDKDTTREEKKEIFKKLTKLEFELQENWNFEKDIKKHKYHLFLPGCTCSKSDNMDLISTGTMYVDKNCPYHYQEEEEYSAIKITDKTNIQIKSKNCKSVDIHLRENDQFVNVILPDNTILVIEPDGEVTAYDETDSLIYSYKSNAK